MFMESWILRISWKVSEARRASNLLCKIPKVFMIPWTFQKFNLLLIFTFYYKYLKYKKKIFNLWIKTDVYWKCNRFNGLVRVQNGKAERPRWTRTAYGANTKLVLHVWLRCGLLSITIPVTLLANEYDVQSVLHGQVCLTAVNQICAIHVAMNGCENLKIH